MAKVILLKTTTVLSRATVRDPANAFISFLQFPDADDGLVCAHAVSVDVEVWRDMGEPDVITVTIEPGDRLNEASGDSAGG